MMEESLKEKVESRKPVTFQIGEQVYSAISPDERGMVTGIILRANGYTRYAVTWSADHTKESDHFEIELSREPLYQQPTR